MVWNGRPGTMVEGPSVDARESVTGHLLVWLYPILMFYGSLRHFIAIRLLYQTLETSHH